jgi:DtxR family transcriptional regulator, Mn-dependent transcriptional regulator
MHMAHDSPSLSRSVEDYLKAIYSLSERGDTASTSNIAAILDVQPASVSGMVKRLAESGYVEHAPYRGVKLTEDGSRAALQVIRRHRILETYLSQRLGYSWDDVHEEAERLEHAASDELIDRMSTALEFPRHDPHGAPIPSRSGDMEADRHALLSEIEAGSLVEIKAVQDEDSDRLRYMEARGLMPGVRLKIESKAPFNGPITLKVGMDPETPQTIGYELARRIRVSVPGE